MVKYAVMTFMYGGWVNSEGGSHNGLIRILAEAGAEGIEAFANHLMDDDAVVKLYKREMADNNIAMPVMDVLANLAVHEKGQREEAYEIMRKGIEICDALNTEIVHVAGCRLSEGQEPGDGRKLIVEGLMDFADDVEKRGMILAFEDFNPSPTLICSASDCLDILNQTDDRVKFVFDTGNFEASGEHAEDNFDALIDRTCHFHFKDFKPSEDQTLCQGSYFGEGRINNREIAAAINGSGYDGWVALESYLQDGNGPGETIKMELDILKGMFSLLPV